MSALTPAAPPAGHTIERTLHDIVRLAACTVDEAAAVGVAIASRDGRLESPAFTDKWVVQVDQAQVRWHEGPCLVGTATAPLAPMDAAPPAPVGTAPIDTAPPAPIVLRIDDMTAERRWPHFAASAARLGVQSMISCSLPLVHGGRRAALNVYAESAGAFDDAAARTAALCAAHSSVAFEQAFLISSLRTALDSRQEIGEATGILMERERVGSPEAFQMLVDASQRLNVKLRRIAQCVVRTGQTPQTMQIDDLTRAW